MLENGEWGHFRSAENWMRYHHIEGFVVGCFNCVNCSEERHIAFTRHYEPYPCYSCGSVKLNIWTPYAP